MSLVSYCIYHKSLETEILTSCLSFSLSERSTIGPKLEKNCSILGDCFVVVYVSRFTFTVVFTFKHHLSCENRIQINNIVSRLHFLVFYSGFNFLSLNSFIVRYTCICDGHLPEEAKSLETLAMKDVLGNAGLDNGRIDIHPLTPRKLSCNLSGGLRS